MIGMKIALTGLILLAVSVIAIKGYGSKEPSLPMQLLQVAMFISGLSSAVAGLIYSIWS